MKNKIFVKNKDDITVLCRRYFDNIKNPRVVKNHMTFDDYNEFLKTRKMPLKLSSGTLVWLNEDGFFHNLNGVAIIQKDKSFDYVAYYLNGRLIQMNEWEEKSRKIIYFLREKINILKNLLEIPELFQEVYYSRKNEFISLMGKI